MNQYLPRCQPSTHPSLPPKPGRRRVLAAGSLYRTGTVVLLGLAIGIETLLPAQSQTASPNTPAPQPTSENEGQPTLRLGSQGTPVSHLQSILKLLGYYTGTVDGLYQESTATAVAAFQQAAGLQPDGIAGTETWNRLLPVAPAISQTTGQTGVQVAIPRPTPSPSPAPSFPAPTAATPTPSPSPAPTPSGAGYTPIAPTPVPSPSPAPTNPPTTAATFPVLRVGMSGTAVTRLQERLKAMGLFAGTVDGIFGSETESAVQQAQRNYNLEPDGVVGPATWEVLLQES